MPVSQNTVVTLTPVNLSSLNSTGGSYSSVTLMLLGDATFGLIGSGGWQVVDRPKQVAATQWFDRSPYQLQFDGLLDGDYGSEYISGALYEFYGSPYWTNGYHVNINGDGMGMFGGAIAKTYSTSGDYLFGSSNSVEPDCAQLRHWLDPVPGTYQPPVLSITGPVDGTDRKWVMSNIEFDEALRDTNTGNRFQQKVKVTLYEYNPSISTQVGYYNLTPAQIYALNATSSNNGSTTPTGVSSKKYVIVKGDTFAKILAKLYPHSTKKATVYQNQFLALNPTNFSFSKLNGGKMVGQTIKVPTS